MPTKGKICDKHNARAAYVLASGEVSGTGAAPYMAPKASIYGTKFPIWH